VANAANTPGARSGQSMVMDAGGNLYLFGGEGLDANGNIIGYLNDLWKYTPGTCCPNHPSQHPHGH
jgi:N-acetylneuraminic acid mutarotase